jgi:hypothetical protein
MFEELEPVTDEEMLCISVKIGVQLGRGFTVCVASPVSLLRNSKTVTSRLKAAPLRSKSEKVNLVSSNLT